MSTPEGVVTAVVVGLSFVGIAVVVLVRRAARRIPIELDPTYDDPTSR
jgi:multisubunit Na+/H+ antiporter MnhC subunit